MNVPTARPQSSTIFKDRAFYRGVLIIPLLAAIEFILMVIVEPPSQVSFVIQVVVFISLLIAALIVMMKHRRFGIGMLVGWLLFQFFPVSWVLFLGFTGNLM